MTCASKTAARIENVSLSQAMGGLGFWQVNKRPVLVSFTNTLSVYFITLLSTHNNAMQQLGWLMVLDNPSVSINREAYLDRFVLPTHQHAQHVQILFAVTGGLQVVTKQSLFMVPKGAGIIIPCGVEHNTLIDPPTDMRVVNLESELNALESVKDCSVIRISPLLAAVVDELATCEHSYSEDSPQARLCRVLLDCINASRVDGLSLPMPMDARIRQIASGLIQAPAEGQGLQYWCSKVGASRRTITRLFVKETGLNFQDYKLRVQIYCSLPLLLEGKSISATAYQVGYDSHSAFSSAFKRVMGVAPNQYRHRFEAE